MTTIYESTSGMKYIAAAGYTRYSALAVWSDGQTDMVVGTGDDAAEALLDARSEARYWLASGADLDDEILARVTVYVRPRTPAERNVDMEARYNECHPAD